MSKSGSHVEIQYILPHFLKSFTHASRLFVNFVVLCPFST